MSTTTEAPLFRSLSTDSTRTRNEPCKHLRKALGTEWLPAKSSIRYNLRIYICFRISPHRSCNSAGGYRITRTRSSRMILHDAIAPAGGQVHLFRQVASLDTIDAHNGQCFSISVVAATSSDITFQDYCDPIYFAKPLEAHLYPKR